MAITTINGKLAVIELEDIWEPGLPMVSTNTIDQADKQQLLWGFPEVLWAAGSALAFILDMNTRLFVYLRSVPRTGDLTTMVCRDLAARSGNMDSRFKNLIDDATP